MVPVPLSAAEVPNPKATKENHFHNISSTPLSPVPEIGFGPPTADFGSIWSSKKARKFQHFQKTSKVRILYFDPPIT